MRTATVETRRALRTAIASCDSAAAWSKMHDVRRVDISDCLNDKPMSARRENRLRVALGLDPLRWQLVELAENQRVVTVTPPRHHKRRAITVSTEEAARLDETARQLGFRSVGAWVKAQLLQDGSVERLYRP